MCFPPRCVICDGVLSGKEQYLCAACTDLPKRIEKNFCFKCGKPVDGEKEYCDSCKKEEKTFLMGRAAFCYDRVMRRSVLRFKYHGRQEYGEYYAFVLYKMFGGWIERTGADALVPVPVHTERLKKRGYNQAAVVARELGSRCNIPVYEDLLLRVKNTLPQKELSQKERLDNLCKAFSINHSNRVLPDNLNCVIIVDDIYTTGSTIEACSKVLRSFGVNKVFFLCVCIGYGN